MTESTLDKRVEECFSDDGCDKYALIDDLYIALKKAEEERRWISVYERLPEMREYGFFNCLVSFRNDEVHESRFNTRTNKFMTTGFKEFYLEPTSWMPLPSPPEETQQPTDRHEDENQATEDTLA